MVRRAFLTLALLLAVCSCMTTSERFASMSPEEREWRLQISRQMIDLGGMMMQQGNYWTTPTINRYYAPPGTFVLPSR